MELIEILTQRLQEKGMAASMIPGFVRSVANIISENPDINIEEVNRQLHSLGWDTIELDYHTLQLIIASIECTGE
jgi:hypothetical protein